jgi:hypothetical protein
VQRRFTSHLNHGAWTPLDGSLRGPVFCSRYDLDQSSLWVLANRSDEDHDGVLLEGEPRPGPRWFELTAGAELHAVESTGVVTVGGRIPARGVAAVIALAPGDADAELQEFLAGQAPPFVEHRKPSLDTLHAPSELRAPVSLSDFAISALEVSNDEFLEFLECSGYTPTEPNRCSITAAIAGRRWATRRSGDVRRPR